MDFIDKIQELASRIPEMLPDIQNEGTTKNALIIPFIQALGYSTSNPKEVKAEFALDMGGNKQDRIDYAIFNNGKAIILIECKPCDANIREATFKQLKKYFTFTDAKFGILTNGIIYRFFSDLVNPGKMDDVPFLELDMMNVKDSVVSVVKNFSKPMDEENASEIANELKCKGQIRAILEREFNKPSKEFVLFFASQIHEGRFVKSVVKQFCGYTKETCDQFIQDKIDDVIKAAKDTAKGKKSPHSNPNPEIKFFIFNGERFEVKFWKDMLPKVCSIMASCHRERFEDILTIKGDIHPYFSKNQGELKSPKLIEGTDIYVRTDFQKGMLLHVSKRVLSLFGYPENIISFGEDQK